MIRVGNGKTNEAALIDYMQYFIQDNGQRETFYDHGTIQLRPYMKLLIPTSQNSFIHFTIEYDYFETIVMDISSPLTVIKMFTIEIYPHILHQTKKNIHKEI